MSTPGQRPSVGRIVHYRNTQDQAAIITAVWTDDLVNLTVFEPSGSVTPRGSVSLGDTAGTWHWPEYVPAFDFPDVPESMVAK